MFGCVLEDLEKTDSPLLRCCPERCILLHSRHDMRIQIEGDRDVRMSEALAGNLRVNAGGQQKRGMGVSEAVKANAGEISSTDGPQPFVREVFTNSWLQGHQIQFKNKGNHEQSRATAPPVGDSLDDLPNNARTQ
jgi:hypothetical protein